MEYTFTKEPSQELIKFCKNKINELDWFDNNYFEDDIIDLIFENGHYSFCLVSEDSWMDEGKYQHSNSIYQLISYNNKDIEYPCEKNIIDKINLFFDLPISRSGSYYSDYFYQYDKPMVMQLNKIHIPEKIIPAHYENRLEKV